MLVYFSDYFFHLTLECVALVGVGRPWGLDIEPAHGHALLVVHLLEVVQEAAPDLLDALVDAILAKVTRVEIGDLPRWHSENLPGGCCVGVVRIWGGS